MPANEQITQEEATPPRRDRRTDDCDTAQAVPSGLEWFDEQHRLRTMIATGGGPTARRSSMP